MLNAFQYLRARCLAESSRPFSARGSAVKRCQRCLLGEPACICQWRSEMSLGVDFILLMHRDEVFKPTNSGRLIADLFPSNTYAYEWSRTQPDAELLTLLADPGRFPVMLFPPGEDVSRTVYSAKPLSTGERRLTLILLDGTWKQARKMYKTSGWLKQLPLMTLPDSLVGQYAVRQALTSGQLATAEAAAALLELCEQSAAAQLLGDYFAIFNQHYVDTRMSRRPLLTSCHQRLQERLGRA